MRYLSIDLEATGLGRDDRIIEFAAVPFCSEDRAVEEGLAFHALVRCPSYESLEPSLSPWVRRHNEGLIRRAHREGVSTGRLGDSLGAHLDSGPVRAYFDRDPARDGERAPEDGGEGRKIVLFGKSLNSIDLPFLSRDLGWDWVRERFHHQAVDLSAVARFMVDRKALPPGCVSGEGLMGHFGMGGVRHTALEDAVNAAALYCRLLGA